MQAIWQARRIRRMARVAATAGLLLMAGASAGSAQEVAQGVRATFRSPRLTVHTDLSAEQSADLLQRMEATLDKTVGYWERPTRERIECYVFDELSDWTDDELPHPIARLIIANVGGAAFGRRVGAGIQVRNSVTVLASTSALIAEHEVVHAYCGQVFGTTGPWWYREGMAQAFTFGWDDQRGLQCTPEIREQLRRCGRRSIAEIVSGGDAAQQLTRELEARMAHHDAAPKEWHGLVALGEWDDSHADALRQMEPFYAWSWLLCHFLHHNPNYRTRFKAMGQDYLARREDTFQHWFGPVREQLDFEYQFMLTHLGTGYRADLCRWDWNKRFRCIDRARKISVRVAAARGYQATGLLVSAGRTYDYMADGKWRLAPACDEVDADGDPHGWGRLEGVVWSDYQLSEPFPLGRSGRFAAPAAGRLYVRCRDGWTHLGDNEGSVVVTFTRPQGR